MEIWAGIQNDLEWRLSNLYSNLQKTPTIPIVFDWYVTNERGIPKSEYQIYYPMIVQWGEDRGFKVRSEPYHELAIGVIYFY